MARKYTTMKTRYSNIYEVQTSNGTKHYIARFSHNGIRYGDKNLSNLYGVSSAKRAFEKLNDIRQELSQGHDVFSTNSNKVEDLLFSYLKTRSEAYKYASECFYNAHIKNTIGHLYIDKVTKEHFNTIKKAMQKKKLATSTIKKAKVILSPIFKEAYNDEIISRNIIESYQFGSDRKKLDLSDRLDESLISTIRKIYSTVLKEDNDYASMFLVSIMCARRMGEILELRHSDIKNNIVHVRASTTKTYKAEHKDKIVEKYILSDEILKRITIKENCDEKIFTYKRDRYLKYYAKFIDTKCNLKFKSTDKEYKVRSHDNRNFIMSIQGRDSGRETVGMICLSHSDSSNMNQRYNSIELDEIISVYESYWQKLRTK